MFGSSPGISGGSTPPGGGGGGETVPGVGVCRGGAFGSIGRGCPITCVTLMKTVGTCGSQADIDSALSVYVTSTVS